MGHTQSIPTRDLSEIENYCDHILQMIMMIRYQAYNEKRPSIQSVLFAIRTNSIYFIKGGQTRVKDARGCIFFFFGSNLPYSVTHPSSLITCG